MVVILGDCRGIREYVEGMGTGEMQDVGER